MNNYKDYGFLTGLFRALMTTGAEFPSRFFLGRRSDLKFSKDEKALYTYAQRRATRVELYVCSWVIIEIACIGFCFLKPLPVLIPATVTGLAILRINEIFLSNVNIGIFRASGNPTVAQLLRIFILLIINYGELWLCFSGLYSAHLSNIKNGQTPWDAIYFSGVTQLTIGYGDLFPLNWLRFVALLQGWIGTMFLLLILGRLLTAMPYLTELGPGFKILNDERLEEN